MHLFEQRFEPGGIADRGVGNSRVPVGEMGAGVRRKAASEPLQRLPGGMVALMAGKLPAPQELSGVDDLGPRRAGVAAGRDGAGEASPGGFGIPGVEIGEGQMPRDMAEKTARLGIFGEECPEVGPRGRVVAALIGLCPREWAAQALRGLAASERSLSPAASSSRPTSHSAMACWARYHHSPPQSGAK
jgi:hypothetical protein